MGQGQKKGAAISDEIAAPLANAGRVLNPSGVKRSPALQQEAAVGFDYAARDDFPAVAVEKIEAVHEAAEVYFFAIGITYEVLARLGLAVVHAQGATAVGAVGGIEFEIVASVGGIEFYAFDVDLRGGKQAVGEQNGEDQCFFHGKK